MLRPRWLSHNGDAGQPLMGVSDWFQAWLALIESPQEALGNHRPEPEPFWKKQDVAEICWMPSSFIPVPIEVQYILGTYNHWNWIDFATSFSFQQRSSLQWSNWSFNMSQHASCNTKHVFFFQVFSFKCLDLLPLCSQRSINATVKLWLTINSRDKARFTPHRDLGK